MRKAQSAMEYLMTYGWAILIIAVVLGAFYSLGLFSAGNFIGAASCRGVPGFECATTQLMTNGLLTITVGQLAGTYSVNGIACVVNNTSPSSFQAVSPTVSLQPSQQQNFTVSCPLSSNSLGASFSGYVWMQYVQNGQPMQIQIGAVRATATQTGATSAPTSTIVYNYNLAISSSTSNPSTTITSGDNNYFCVVASVTTISSHSWTQDASVGATSMGHQTSSNTCSASISASVGSAIAGVGENGATSYTLQASGSSSATPGTFTYNVGDTGQYTFILLARQYSTLSSVGVSPSSGTCAVEENGGVPGGYGGWVYIYVCYGQAVGTYTVSVSSSSSGFALAYAAYSVN